MESHHALSSSVLNNTLEITRAICQDQEPNPDQVGCLITFSNIMMMSMAQDQPKMAPSESKVHSLTVLEGSLMNRSGWTWWRREERCWGSPLGDRGRAGEAVQWRYSTEEGREEIIISLKMSSVSSFKSESFKIHI